MGKPIEKTGWHTFTNFNVRTKQKDYLLKKKQEFENEVGYPLSFAEFMRLFIERQPDFKEVAQEQTN